MNIDTLLRNYVTNGELSGAILLSDDGTILQSHFAKRMSSRLVEQIEWIKKTVYDIHSELQQNRLEKIIYVLSDSVIQFTKVGGSIILVSMATPDTDMNQVNYLSAVYSRALMAEIQGISVSGEEALI